MSDSKIVSLRGEAPPDTGLVNPYIVELLENLLTRAKRGDVVGVALAYVKPNRATQTTWCGMENGYTHELNSAVTTLAFRMQAEGVMPGLQAPPPEDR